MSSSDLTEANADYSCSERYPTVGVSSSWRFLELLAVLVISVSILGLVAMRLGVFQAPQVWIVGFAATYAYARFAPTQNWGVGPDVPYWHLLLVIAVALIFRLPPFTYLLGGQDEGIYMNMAAELTRTGALQPSDSVLEGISSTKIRELYLQANYRPQIYMPAVYATADGLEFQFYHLFPVWLAMFGSIFGVHGTAYALTFLSLVSILFFQRLAHAISGSAKAGLIAGVLLALNPLHAFFSKFPVTEIPTLAFSTLSFTCLIAGLNSNLRSGALRYLVISLLALGMMFMVRISGFMYLPLLLLLAVTGLLAGRGTERRLRLFPWALIAIGLYAASVLYGLKWSAVYSGDIYRASFRPLLGDEWPAALAVLAVAIALVIAALWWASRKEQVLLFLNGMVQSMSRLLPLLVIALTAIAAWKAYKLGYTDAYSSQPGLNALAARGMHSVRSVSLVAAASYLSPFMLLAFLVAAFRNAIDTRLKLVLFFVVCFYAHLAALQWVLRYQPYYARYLVSELIPYVILFVVCSWSAMAPGALRKFIAAMMVLAGGIAIAASLQQIGDSEHEGLPKSLDRLAAHFDSKDLVLVDSNLAFPQVPELKTTLVYTYGLSVATANEKDLGPQGYARSLSRSYQDVYFLTRNMVPPQGFVEVDSIEYWEQVFCHGIAMPVSLCTRADSRLMVYKRPLPAPSKGAAVLEFGANDRSIKTLVGKKGYGWIQANGNAGFVMFGPYVPLASGKYTVIINGYGTRPFTLDIVASRATEVIARKDLDGAVDPDAEVLARQDFDLSNPVQDLEVRIKVEAGSDIEISGYRIEYR